MFEIIYVTADPIRDQGAQAWADQADLRLIVNRVLGEIADSDVAALVVDWDYCLDPERFDPLLTRLAGRSIVAIHGYGIPELLRRRCQAAGALVYRYQELALQAVAFAARKAA
jgi:hypothetical protein